MAHSAGLTLPTLFVLCVSVALSATACQSPKAPPRSPSAAEPMSLDAAMALIDARDDWGKHPPINIPRHPAEKHLAGMTIVLDPGHGASDGIPYEKDPTYKRGPTGVREDDINLRVGLLLARLLRDAGANVILTRDADVQLGLRERAQVTNTAPRPDGGAGADLFISIHHNAVNNPNANYSSVWYHGEVDDAEVALDIGRYIAHRLGAALRTDVARTSPLLSDQLMYGGGFGVLRACEVPGILLESSFFSHPAEEQRLRDAGYNLREAYAIYEGLCEYAYGGRPTQTVQLDRDAGISATEEGLVAVLVFDLDDGLPDWWGKDRNRILTGSIQAREESGKALIPVLQADAPNRRRVVVPVALSPAAGGGSVEQVVEFRFQNMFKHHNHPQRYRVRATPLTDGQWVGEVTALPVRQASPPTTRPASPPATQPAGS